MESIFSADFSILKVSFTVPIGILSVHTKRRNELEPPVEQARTNWNQLEPSGTSWNQLERAETRWSYQRLALERVRVVSCNGSCYLLLYALERKFETRLQ